MKSVSFEEALSVVSEARISAILHFTNFIEKQFSTEHPVLENAFFAEYIAYKLDKNQI